MQRRLQLIKVQRSYYLSIYTTLLTYAIMFSWTSTKAKEHIESQVWLKYRPIQSIRYVHTCCSWTTNGLGF